MQGSEPVGKVQKKRAPIGALFQPIKPGLLQDKLLLTCRISIERRPKYLHLRDRRQ